VVVMAPLQGLKAPSFIPRADPVKKFLNIHVCAKLGRSQNVKILFSTMKLFSLKSVSKLIS
jgi:hypothetical protein